MSRNQSKRGLCGVLLCVFAFLVAVLVAVAVLWYCGVFGEFSLELAEDGMRIEHTTAGERQAEVIAALRGFVKAQKAFKREYGSYAASTEALISVDGADANAAVSTSPIMCHHGYYFNVPAKYGRGRLDLRRDFILVAEPAEYAPGTPTYAVGPKGIVLQKDMGGTRVTNATQINGSWTRAE